MVVTAHECGVLEVFDAITLRFVGGEVVQESKDLFSVLLGVTTLILNKYQQSSNSSVLAFEFKVSRTTQSAYC
jgi:hypothetical protein